MTRHSWDHNNPKRFPACESPDGNERTLRPCLNEGCGISKVTVHGGDGTAWRAWRRGDDEWQAARTPACEGRRAVGKPSIAAQSTAEVIAR